MALWQTFLPVYKCNHCGNVILALRVQVGCGGTLASTLFWLTYSSRCNKYFASAHLSQDPSVENTIWTQVNAMNFFLLGFSIPYRFRHCIYFPECRYWSGFHMEEALTKIGKVTLAWPRNYMHAAQIFLHGKKNDSKQL